LQPGAILRSCPEHSPSLRLRNYPFAKRLFSGCVGWKPIRNPPYHADEMRKLAHQNRANDQLPHRPEYWFKYFDGRVMLCERIKDGSCGATIAFFAQDESGAMVISNPGLEIMCVSQLR
jgi:hypothetical protein